MSIFIEPTTNRFAENIRFLREGPTKEQENVKLLTEAAQQAGSATTTPTTTTPTTATETPAQQAPENVVQPSQTGDIYSRLFQPLRQEQEQAQQQLEAAKTQFYEQAGPERTWTPGMETTMRGAVGMQAPPDIPRFGSYRRQYQDIMAQQAAEQPQLYEQAQGLVGAEYGGPTGLDTTELGALDEALGRVYQTGQSLGAGADLPTLIGQAAPGLTPGERRQEAQRLLADPAYRSQVEAARANVANLMAKREQEEEKALTYGTQRAQQEADIQEQARDFLGGLQSEVEGAIQKKMSAAEAKRQAVSNAYARLQEGQLPILAESYAPGISKLISTYRERPTFWEQHYLDMGMAPEVAVSKSRRMEEIMAGGARPSLSLSDISEYLDLVSGSPITRESMATPNERAQFNKINELLGLAGQIRNTDPYTADQILVDVDRRLKTMKYLYG